MKRSGKVMKRRGMSLRLRLTLSYGGVFFAVALLLVLAGYLAARQAVIHDPLRLREGIVSALHLPASYLDQSMPAPSGGQQPVGDFTLQVQDATVSILLHGLAVAAFWSLAVATAVSIGVGWLVAGRMLRPLHEIAGVARSLSASTLNERIALQGPRDELQELADTFDAMLGRLERAFEGQREFVANASHELRTPLAIVRTELDVTLSDPAATLVDYRRMAESIRTAMRRSEDIVEKLLVLAESEELRDRADVNLEEMTAAVVERHRPDATTRGLSLSTVLQPAHVVGDGALLERLVDNLLDNAVRYAPSGSTVAVELDESAGMVRLRVANDGEVIRLDELAHLFDRFYRREASRSRSKGGSGLGLAIVEAVARAHHGDVRAESPTRGGLVVSVELPAAGREA